MDRTRKPADAGRLKLIFFFLIIAASIYLTAIAAICGIPSVDMPAWPGLSVLAVNIVGFGIVGLVVCLQGHPCSA